MAAVTQQRSSTEARLQSRTFGDPAEDVLEGAGDDAGGLALAAFHSVRLPAPRLAVSEHRAYAQRSDQPATVCGLPDTPDVNAFGQTPVSVYIGLASEVQITGQNAEIPGGFAQSAHPCVSFVVQTSTEHRP